MKRVILATRAFRNVRVRADRWGEFIKLLEEKTGLEIDSAYRRQPMQWIFGYKDGLVYEIETEKYYNGGYDLMGISEIGPKDEWLGA